MLSLLLFGLLIIVAVSLSRQRDSARADGYRQGLQEGYRLAKSDQPLPTDVAPSFVNNTGLSDAVASRPDAPSGAINRSTQSTAMPAAVSAIKPPSLEDRRRARQQTINITLYVASLVLVGGIALFAAAVQSGGFSVVTAWMIVAAYYGVGLWLHESSKSFRMVATAFVATALAGMPFVGVLFDTMIGISASSAWLLTSAICLLAYGYAAIRLRYEILGYALGAVIVSIGLAVTSTLGVGMLWFFVVILVIAICLAAVSWVLGRDSQFTYLVRPLIIIGQILPPLTLFASIVLSEWLGAADYAVIWAVAGSYYASQAGFLASKARQRSINWAVSRIVMSFAAMFATYAVTSRIDLTVFIAAIIGVGQVATSTLAILGRSKVSAQHDISLWFGLGLTLLAPVLFVVVPEIGASGQRLMTAIVLVFAASASLASARWLKRAELGYFATASLTVLPWYLVEVIDRNTSSDFYALGYLIAAALLVAGRVLLRYQAGPKTKLYTAVTLGILALIGGAYALTAEHGMQAAVLVVFAVLLYLVGGRDRALWLVAAANVFVLGALRAMLAGFGFTTEQVVALMSAVGALLFTIDYLGLRYLLAKYPRLQLVQAGTVVVVGLSFGLLGLMVDGGYGMVAMAGPLLAGTLLILEQRRLRRGAGLAIGVVTITIALQRLLALIADPISVHVLVYTHWWVAVFAGLAYVQWQARSPQLATAYIYIALTLLSVFGVAYAFGENIMFRVLFLLEHATLVIAGLALSWRVLTWWGAAGITLAVLYMFRGFTSLFLTLIGLIIILAVIWVVRRDNQKTNL